MSARSGERPAPGALFNYQCITLVKWKELIIKGVRRQRNRGCILALIMSSMMVMMIWSHHYQHQTGRSLRQKKGGEHRNASYDSVAEECEERGTTWTRSTIQLSSISVRVCHERCLAAEEYRLYTGFVHVEDDFHDYLDSSLSASKRAGIPSKERRGASKVFLRQLPEECQKRGTASTRSTHQFNRFRLSELFCSLFRHECAWLFGPR